MTGIADNHHNEPPPPDHNHNQLPPPDNHHHNDPPPDDRFRGSPEDLYKLIYTGNNLPNRNNRYFSPSSDLPANGFDGLSVEGLSSGITFHVVPGGSSPKTLKAVAKHAALQWTRHLGQSPGDLRITSGGPFCNNDLGCLTMDDLIFINPQILGSSDDLGSDDHLVGEGGTLLWVFVHEIGHFLGYFNPDGHSAGCHDFDHLCHAPYDSDSVMEWTLSDSAPYPNQEDLEHINQDLRPRYKPQGIERYEVTRSSPVGEWGIWIEHDSRITRPGRWSNIVADEIHDNIAAGTILPSSTTGSTPTGSATYTGNFLGLDMSTAALGELLKADATLTWLSSAGSTVALDNFESYRNGGWDDSRIPNHTATPADITHHDGGWVAGSITNHDLDYIGAFTASLNP